MINEIKNGTHLHFACCMLHFSFDFAFGSTLNLIDKNGSAESEFDSILEAFCSKFHIFLMGL